MYSAKITESLDNAGKPQPFSFFCKMMKMENLFSRYRLLWVIAGFYLLPIVALIAYHSFGAPSPSKDWKVLSTGFFLTTSGSLALFWLMSMWEANLKGSQTAEDPISALNPTGIDPEEYAFSQRALEEAQQTQIRLLAEIDILTEDIRQLTDERDQQARQAKDVKEQLDQLDQTMREQLEQQQIHIRDLQGTIAEQKVLDEKKQHQIGLLETKVADLTYEIKTLLKFAEAHSDSLLSTDTQEPFLSKATAELPEEPTSSFYAKSSIRSNQEASQQLKRCIDIAQKITGSQRFGSQLYSFLDSPADRFSLDLRRLCDRLRSEDNGTVLLYSPQEDQLLFASNQIKALTGWSPDKFMQHFSEILQGDYSWKQGVDGLAMRSESQVQLSLKARSGQNVPLQAHLGMIPTGIFRNHVIAVLY